MFIALMELLNTFKGQAGNVLVHSVEFVCIMANLPCPLQPTRRFVLTKFDKVDDKSSNQKSLCRKMFQLATTNACIAL